MWTLNYHDASTNQKARNCCFAVKTLIDNGNDVIKCSKLQGEQQAIHSCFTVQTKANRARFVQSPTSGLRASSKSSWLLEACWLRDSLSNSCDADSERSSPFLLWTANHGTRQAMTAQKLSLRYSLHPSREPISLVNISIDCWAVSGLEITWARTTAWWCLVTETGGQRLKLVRATLVSRSSDRECGFFCGTFHLVICTGKQHGTDNRRAGKIQPSVHGATQLFWREAVLKLDCTQSLSFLLVLERLDRARCATARETGVSASRSLQSFNYCGREKKACSLS